MPKELFRVSLCVLVYFSFEVDEEREGKVNTAGSVCGPCVLLLLAF